MASEPLFNHLSATGPAPTHHEVMARYEEAFAARVAAGVVRPLVIPHFFFGMALLFAYLCIPHTKSPIIYAARWPVVVTILSFQLSLLAKTSSGNVGVAALSGGASSIVVLLTLTWLVWCKPQFDAKRVQRRRKRKVAVETKDSIKPPLREKQGHDPAGYRPQGEVYTTTVRNIHVLIAEAMEDEGLRQRQLGNGELNKGAAPEDMPSVETDFEEANSLNSSAGEQDEFEYYWESYPDNLLDRIPWLVDLFLNTRGIGWNWAIPTIPDLPDSIKEQLGEPITHPPKKVGNRSFTSTRALLRYRLPQLLICYMVFDAIKTLQMKDPYFIFGPNTYDLPPHLANLAPFWLFCYRYLFCCIIGFVVPLQFAFVLQDIAMALLGPGVLGVAAEPWHMPTTWGTLNCILHGGMAGFWGKLWHQRLRFIFSAPSTYLIDHGYMAAGSAVAKWTSLLLAFAISGFIHAAISIGQFQPTEPWRMFSFFLLQAMGIALQTAVCEALHPAITKLPRWLRDLGNFGVVFVWAVVTGPIFADDVAKGGSWLNEPVPISPLRGLGLGIEGDGWWCWSGYIRGGWHQGKHWWESGYSI
jgi:hypothetical protein